MADLIPLRPITTAQAPRANLSSGEIAAPFNDLARVVGSGGEAAEAGAEKLATKAGEEAGRNSVRTADDGSLVVSDTSNPFIIGKAGTDYERAAKMTQAARIQPQVETDMLQLRLAHPNDPGGFKAAATAYSQKTLQSINDPNIRGAVGDMLATNAEHNERTALVEANSHNTAEAMQTYQARIKDLNEKMSSVARQGGTDAPEYLAMAKDRATFWNQLQADPRFKFSKERADLEINEAWSGDKVQEVIGKVQRQFMQDKDLPKAKQALQNAFWGPGSDGLNLTAAKRDHGVAEGVHAITNLSAIDHEAITENRKAVAGWLVDTQTKPRGFDLGQALNLKQRALDIGDDRSAHEIDEAVRFQPLWSAFHSASPQGQSEMLAEMRRGVVPEFGVRSKGVDENLLAVATRAQQISGIPFAIGDKGGMRDQATQDQLVGGGFSQTRNSNHLTGRALDLLPVVNGKMVAEGTPAQHAEVARAMKQAATELGVPVNWGGDWQSFKDVAHFELPRDGAAARSVVPGQKIDLGAASATARLFESTVKEASGVVSKNAQTAFDRIEKNAKEGATIQPDDVQHFAEMASLSGRDDLLDKAKPWMSALDVQKGLPPGQTSDVLKGQIAELRAQGVDGVAADTLDHLQMLADAGEKRMKENPLAESAARGWTGGPRQLALDNPGAFGNEIVSREKNIGIIQQADHVPNAGAIPAIMPTEAKPFAAALTQGDPKTAGTLLASLQANLSSDNWRATMAVPAVKDALTDMLNSNDPARMDVGGQAMDRLWSTNEADFKKTYGDGALTRLMAWKGLSALTSAERTERLNKADDPFSAKSRKDIGEAADTKYKTWSADDVAYQLGTSWGVPLLSRAANLVTHATPGAPIDGVAAGAMKAEFENASKQMQMYGVPPDRAQSLAVEKMKAEWQPSAMMHNTLMRHAPETYYPADPISGNRDWMTAQLEAEITRIHGPKQSAALMAGGEGGMTVFPGWNLKGIVSDNRTAQDVAAGKPPSYQIAITDKNGQDQFLRDPETGRDRFVWDPKQMLAPRQAEVARTFSRAEGAAARNQPPMRGGAPPPGSFQSLGAKPFMQGELPLGGS